MTHYTAEQVEQAIQDSPQFETWEGADEWLKDGQNWAGGLFVRADNRLVLDIDGVTEYAEFEGGKMPSEGGGEEVWAVVKVGTQYFRKEGYYASHYGTDWDGDVTEVTPTPKMVTFYEPV
jgi:hypothetical protein